ncbi:MAG TPA: hypothetical protein DCE41_25910 [Cytophagales bacterium]|nr:hypothetical protein [Cytophagales bacterium]HAA20267.1 hypothetical protein [Cytophagales bacterium]HAP58004.1 hypothetical protein [Cytophagales bacterium]
MGNINVDLFGWDTSFGISFQQANQSIVDQKKTPTSFDSANPGPGTIKGNWSDWSLTLNGDGKNINLRCPIREGVYTPVMPADSGKLVKLDGNYIEVQVRLAAFDSSAAWYDSTSQKGSGSIKQLQVKASGGTSEKPVASIYSTSISKGSPAFSGLSNPMAEAAVCKAAFETYFTDHLKDFENIFSYFTLNAKADKGHFQWLKATTSEYAVETTGDMDTSIFSVLAMTENRPAPGSQATDPRLLKAASSSAIFAIAKKRFLDKWLLPGVALSNAGTSVDDYFMFSDTLISNNKTLYFKNQVQNKDKRPTTLKVPEGKFNIGTFDNQMEVKFEGASFEWTDGITCVLNYSDYYTLSLLPGDGHNALHVTPVDKLPTIEMSMKVADWRQQRDLWVEIGVSIGVSVLGALLAPALGPLVGKAFGAIADSAIAKAISAGVDSAVVSITEVIEKVAATSIGKVLAAAFETATDFVGGVVDQIGSISAGSKTIGELLGALGDYVAGKATSIGQFLMSKRYLIIGGMIGGGIGVVLGDIPKIMTANDKMDVPNMASLNEFTNNAVGAIKWPSGVFKLSSAQLEGVLLLGGQLE